MTGKRVIGIETEYGITCASTTGDVPPIEPEEAAQRLFQRVLEMSKSTNTFLPNGARLYLDVGAHPEYASAECDQIDDLLANDRAGDELYAQMAASANEKLAKQGIPGRIHLFKNNVDSEGNSFGCHENYLVRRRRDFRARIDSLIPFFVTRQILVGAGHLRKDADGSVSYEISQRAEQMWDAVSSASTRSRPMINTRDEPHGDAELYRRMHVIVGDSNMSEPTTALKVGTTEALLNVIEDGVWMPNFALADPTHAIRQVSLDLTGKAEVALASGETTTALDIQRRVFDLVHGHYEKTGWLADLDPTRRYVFDLWERTLTALETGATDAVATEIDWIAKKRLLERYVDRLGTDWSDPRIARLDLAWHDITDKGLRANLEATGGLRTVLAPEAIQRATGIPPQTTRAKLRGDFVAAAMDHRRDYMVDWMNLRLLTDGGANSLILKDPFVAADARVDALIEQMES